HPGLAVAIMLAALVGSRLAHHLGDLGATESVFGEFVRDLCLGFGYTVALAGSCAMRLPFARLHERLADFSYTTYLCHFPLMLFSVAVGVQVFGVDFHIQPQERGLLYFWTLVA